MRNKNVRLGFFQMISVLIEETTQLILLSTLISGFRKV